MKTPVLNERIFNPYGPQPDVDPKFFVPVLNLLAGPFTFITPTETGMKKSIMDATFFVRSFLEETGLHFYQMQNQGPENKVVLDAYFVNAFDCKKTKVSLYRPNTKKGDPRIWFSGLQEYAKPRNLLCLIAIEGAIYVINFSNPTISYSAMNAGFVAQVLSKSRNRGSQDVFNELLGKLKEINKQGYIETISPSDPGVGETLEAALGIERNNDANPDYKGIELKAKTTMRNGRQAGRTRQTLFSKTPDMGMTYSQIVKTFGKLQTPRQYAAGFVGGPRIQIEESCYATKVNAYGLYLALDEANNTVDLMHSESRSISGGVDARYVSSWKIDTLKAVLANKHRATMWVKASSQVRNGITYFRYEKAEFTENPNLSIFPILIGNGTISVDLLGYVKDSGSVRDHGMLFKIYPKDMPLLFGTPKVFDLSGD